MADATILLASDHPEFIRSIRSAIASVPHVQLVVLPEIDAVYNHGDWSGVGLVLIHRTSQSSVLQINRLLGMITAARRPAAVVVVGESFESDQRAAYHRMGVVDCLELPTDHLLLNHLCHVLTLQQRAGDSLAGAASSLRPLSLSRPEVAPPPAPILDGESAQVQNLVDLIRRAAPQSATVLLAGETGTGKTHLARQIHGLSNRRDEPFVTIHCSPGTSTLIEGELFGHVQGAFEGATTDRVGKFAEVGRGTLFLDGVESLPPAVQAKLLRVVEDRTFEPLGGSRPQPLKARLIAATNRPLDEEIAEGRFRSDLFYRLNVIGLHLPPLRERRDAIPILANRFLQECGVTYGRNFESLNDDTVHALQKHDWPGNVRELRNVLDCCAATCPDCSVRPTDLPSSVLESLPQSAPRGESATEGSAGGHPSSLAVTKGQAELARITEALERHNDNRLRTAAELGISRMTLYKKLYKYGLMDPPVRTSSLVPRP